MPLAAGGGGESPGGRGGSRRSPPPRGLKASAHLLPAAGCAPPDRPIRAHRARAAPQCTRTHTHTHPETHMNTRALAHTSLCSASPTCRAAADPADSGMQRSAPALEQRLGLPTLVASGSGRRSAGAGLGRGLEPGLPRRPAPPRGLRPAGDGGVVSSGAGGTGLMRMRTGAEHRSHPGVRWLRSSRGKKERIWGPARLSPTPTV